jgi:hypothetical protein
LGTIGLRASSHRPSAHQHWPNLGVQIAPGARLFIFIFRTPFSLPA